MATRNLRTRMSSRLSSPAVHAEPAAGPGDKNIETTEDPIKEDDEDNDGEWREPPVRVLPPSYKDYKGLERLGVLEQQQPLGVPPSQKLLQRLKLTFNRPSNRGTPLPDDEIMSQGLDSEVADTGSPMDAEIAAPAEPEQMAISSPPRGRPSNKDMAAMQSAHPVETPSPVQSNFEGTPLQSASAARPMSIQDHLRQERVQNYVNRAVNEAQDRGDLGLVPGLEKIRRNANDKRDLWRVLESIAHQNPTPEQLHIFKKFIKKGLHKYRREVASSVGAGSEPFLGVDNGINSEQNLREGRTTLTSPFRTRATSGHLHADTPSRRRKNVAADSHSPNAKTPAKSSRRKRRTSNASISSASSLSSIESVSTQSLNNGVSSSGVVKDEDVELDGGRGASQGGRQAGEATSAAPRLRLVNKNSSIPPSDSNNETTQISSKVISEKLKKSQQAREEAEQELAEVEKRRKKLEEKSFKDYNYLERRTVNDRHHIPELEDDDIDFAPTEEVPPPPVLHPNPVGQKAESTNNSSRPGKGPRPDLMNGTARKRDFDEFAESEDESEPLTPLSSSPAPPYDPPPPPPNALASRSATPRISLRNSGPPAKAARKSARVMVSPNKPKNGGITAGFTRAGPPARIAELGGGADSSQESHENDEHCASCGGEGTLLCCDGCTNSFHHSCLEPPLNPDEEVEGTWYCPRCAARQKKSTEESKTFLGRALGALDHVIPRAFALPLELREYFEGVRTGDEGEYTEFGQPRTHTTQPKLNRAGFIEEPNYKEPRDSKTGKLLICKGCGLGANGKDLIPCDYCDAKWHLDCVDPPLAIPPRRKQGDKPNATWRCPLHVEHDLAQQSRRVEAAPGDLGGVPKLRKPKKAKPRDVDFPRGFHHNGIIEVELDDEVPKIREIDMDGGVFRIPEQAIKLDFIDRVKRSWYEDKTFPYTANGRRPPRFVERDYRPTRGVVLHEPQQTTITIKEPEFYKGSQALSIVETAKANAELRRKTLPEQQAVLSLTSLAKVEEDSAYADSLADLTNALIAEAPEQVTQGQVRDERASLQHLQALINRRLNILDGREGEVLPPPMSDRPEKPNRAPHNKYSRAPSMRAEQKEAMWNVARERGMLRNLQPAPPSGPGMSPTYAQQGGGFGIMEGMVNGGAQQQYYGAAPPPQPGQQVAYPFPHGPPPPGGPYHEWQHGTPGNKQAPLQANVSPWQPPGTSPNKSPFAPNNGVVGAGSPTSFGIPPNGGAISYPGTPLAPAPPGLFQGAGYGPPPPPAGSVGMQRQSSLAQANNYDAALEPALGSGRRASLQGPVESQEQNQNAFAVNQNHAGRLNGTHESGNGVGAESADQGQGLPGKHYSSTDVGEGGDGNIDPALFSGSTVTAPAAKDIVVAADSQIAFGDVPTDGQDDTNANGAGANEGDQDRNANDDGDIDMTFAIIDQAEHGRNGHIEEEQRNAPSSTQTAVVSSAVEAS